MPVRLRIASDTHLSTITPEAVANWRAVVADVGADPPDIVVHTGDLTADGALRPDDLALAADELARIPVPWFAVPGNHDIGDTPLGPGQAGSIVSSGYVGQFHELFGPDHWAVDAGPWRLVGVDALVLGSGLPEEDEQWAWLEDVLDVGTPIAVFLHKPLGPPPGVRERGGWRFVPDDAARRLAALLARHRVRTVVSGHLHEHRAHVRSGVAHLWVPTAWAALPHTMGPAYGERQCGVLDLVLGDDGTVEPMFRQPPGLVDYVLGENLVDPYAA